jgi:hypothetical protein
MLSAALAGEVKAVQPRDRDEALRWIYAMARIAVSDGAVAPAEMQLLRTAGARIGLVEYDLGQIIQRQRRDLFTAARDRLRNGPNR